MTRVNGVAGDLETLLLDAAREAEYHSELLYDAISGDSGAHTASLTAERHQAKDRT